MTTAQQVAWLDQLRARRVEAIRKTGVFITYVGGVCECPSCGGDSERSAPSFAYTTGLFGIGHPELVIRGCDPVTSQKVLETLATRIRGGDDLMVGEVVAFDGWPCRFYVIAVPDPGQVVAMANDFYQRPPEASVPAYALEVSDADGRFPWDGA